MVFSSVEFLLYFLPIFMLLYAITPKAFRNVTLLSGSLIFYAYGEPKYLVLLVVSVLVNYFVGLHVAKGKKESRNRHNKRKRLLIIAIIGNVSVLALFKGAPNELGLPLGISFYTFQILSYLIDVYRGDIHRERSFIKLTTYITMFPQLISGPIVNYNEVSAQLKDREITAHGIQDGIKVFIVGLAFKVLLADRVGLLWREVQTTGFESISTALSWIAAVAYSMKIYFDFYGYSLMAIGLGRMLGFELPENFREPYMARGVRDFYRRWHITLGRWFRSYVYIPLGGSYGGELRTALNLLVVWVLTSIWHGGTLNFPVWGLSLWFFIVLERQFSRFKLAGYMKLLPHLYLWVVIPVTWMCFAIADLGQLQVYLGRMFGLIQGINVNMQDWQKALTNYGGLLIICFAACTPLLKKIYAKFKDSVIGQLVLGGVFWWCIWHIIVEGNNTFMYFRF